MTKPPAALQKVTAYGVLRTASPRGLVAVKWNSIYIVPGPLNINIWPNPQCRTVFCAFDLRTFRLGLDDTVRVVWGRKGS